jgi:hypothetical protein
VLRIKIETVPWHPSASVLEGEQYFESHLAVECPVMEREILSRIAKDLGCHASRNVNKVIEDTATVMVTYRSQEPREGFEASVKARAEAITLMGFKVAKTIVEFAIFDTNRKHDAVWLES